MKSQTEIYQINHQIENYQYQIKQIQIDVDNYEQRKRTDAQNANIYDREITSRRDQINQIQRSIDELVRQLST